ncbi:MAG: putative cyclin-box carrying protein [Streblomastix strix]|uniref:Putative cyclin-box carrying protein n=1 Tax=Streblomastix strix TaxID=222440 RepID=A0A5J4VXD4_9EUKA|nr:MAG: putative cyclin-box carrying protein [Streblomastix strix]
MNTLGKEEKRQRKRFFLSADMKDIPTSSPATPDVDYTVMCVCKQLRTLLAHSVKHPKSNPKIVPVFCENLKALEVDDIRKLTVPELGHMQIFMLYIIQQLKMDAQCAIIALIYIERLITDVQITLHPINWRRFVVISLLTSAKVWEDRAIFNSHIVKRAFPFFKVADINKMEEEFLNLLNFNLQITSKEYLEYYFSLRELGGAQFIEQLKNEELQKLEKSSLEQGQKAKNAFLTFDAGKATHSANAEGKKEKENIGKKEISSSSSPSSLPSNASEQSGMVPQPLQKDVKQEVEDKKEDIKDNIEEDDDEYEDEEYTDSDDFGTGGQKEVDQKSE